MTELAVCIYCDEPCEPNPDRTVGTMMGPRYYHQECALREVLGGIGHHIAHEWWCETHHDPDAGFTRHESALMVAFMYEIMGNAMMERDPVTGASARGVGGELPPEPPASSDDEWEQAVLAWASGEEPPPPFPPPPPASLA